MDSTKMYLQRRNGRWGFRRPIPKDLQPFIAEGCRTEIVISLKTKDSREASRRYADALLESDRILEEAENRRKAARGRPMPVARVKTKQTGRLACKPLYEFSRQELETMVQQWYAKAKPEAIAEAQFIFNFGGREDREEELRQLEKQLHSLERRSPTEDDFALSRQIRILIEEAGGCMTAVYPARFIETHLWLKSTVRECLLSINLACSSILRTGVLPAVEKPMQIVQQSPVVVQQPAVSVTLDELIEQFDNDPKNQDWERKTRDEFKLIYDLLRECLGGSTPIVHRFVESLEEKGVSLYWHAQGIETLLSNGKRNPAASIMLALLAEMARNEVETLSIRIKSGLEEARRKGRKLGRPQGTGLEREELLSKHRDIIRQLKAGQSVRNTAKITGKGMSTVQRVKAVMVA